MGKIKSVIFDWGGVLIDDPAPALMQYCANALCVSKQDYVKTHRRFAADFQKGRMSEDTFWERICHALNVPKPKAQSLWAEAFEAAYAPREDMFSMAASLQAEGYKTAVLSNTEVPAMHYFHRQKYNMFDVLVFSCAEGVKKPDREIYEIALDKLASRPGQTVLIDDKPEYIKGAKEAGLNTIMFKNAEQVKNELARLAIYID